jgi:surface protein
MFAGTDCVRADTPDPRNLASSNLCGACTSSASAEAAPSPSPISLSDGFSGAAFSTTAELLSAVDAYMLDSSATSDVAAMYGYPIGNWDVSRIANFDELFSGKRNPNMLAFNADLRNWDVSSATSMRAMFESTVSFIDVGDSLAQWDVGHVTDMSHMFDSSAFAGDVSQWDVSKVRDFGWFAEFAVGFNSDLSLWNVGSAENMGWMFRGAKSFASDISAWNVAKVTDFTSM